MKFEKQCEALKRGMMEKTVEERKRGGGWMDEQREKLACVAAELPEVAGAAGQEQGADPGPTQT